jgi:hypothetical protein
MKRILSPLHVLTYDAEHLYPFFKLYDDNLA